MNDSPTAGRQTIRSAATWTLAAVLALTGLPALAHDESPEILQAYLHGLVDEGDITQTQHHHIEHLYFELGKEAQLHHWLDAQRQAGKITSETHGYISALLHLEPAEQTSLAPAPAGYTGDGNVVLLGHVDPQPPSPYYSDNSSTGQLYNGVWGYAVGAREYALQTNSGGLHILDVTDPATAYRVQYIPMAGGRVWRDVDIHEDLPSGKTYAYVGAQSGGNLWVVDLSYLSASTPHGVDSDPIPPAGYVDRGRSNYGHTVSINDGLLFMNSANSGSTLGCQIFDLAQDPWNPPVIAAWSGSQRDCHDSFARVNVPGSGGKDLLYSADGYARSYRILDITNVRTGGSPTLVGQTSTASGIYGHSNWLSEDSKYLYAFDEFNVRDIAVYDVSDPASPTLVGTAIAAAAVVVLPFLAWAGAHYEPDSFGLAAAWVVGGSLLLVLGAPSPRLPAQVFPAVALLAGGAVSVGLASETDRPLALLLLLAVQAGLAVLVRRRWAWGEAAGVTLGALAVLAWYDRHFRPDDASEALALGLGLAGVYVGILAVRGLVLRTPLGVPDAAAQIVAAGLAWLLLDRVLTLTQPDLLGLAAAALAALHLALGLAARRQGPAQVLWARVALALSAVFLTLAIPVQLGLFGITLAWAGEALVLLWLGVRHDSRLARLAGYIVLLLAVGRLLVRHLPLHDGPFTPVLNPAFGTWLLVIAAVAAARWMTSAARARGSALDIWAGRVLAPLGLALLFGLCTAETQSFFAERARAARAVRDSEAAVAAGRQAGLALSVLWTLFATGLLAAGLAVRSRGLFYTAYALFGVTAVKVVMIDLATMPTLYRMLSFLALGVLLLAGAWLNLRFRERLLTPGGDP